MGNTNLPQAGGAGTVNGRDTPSGKDQLTDQERKERQRDDRGIGPSPSRPKNARHGSPANYDPGKTGEEKRDRNDRVEQSTRRDADHPENSGDPVAYGGHARTGHSPGDATRDVTDFPLRQKYRRMPVCLWTMKLPIPVSPAADARSFTCCRVGTRTC